MFKTSAVALALAFVFSGSVFAQEKKSEGQTTIKIEDAADQKNQVKSGEDMDEVITNKKMRAEAGSKSKHSLNSSIAYNGSTLEKPMADIRPNLRGRADATTVASLGGSVAYKYSLATRDAIKAGVGFRLITPFAGVKNDDIPANYRARGGKKSDIDNPYLTYQKVYKWMGVQSVLSAGPTFITNQNLRGIGMVSNWGISQNNAIELGSSGVSLGFLVAASATTFDRHSTAMKVRQQDYDLGFYPFAEYVINDTFNLRTISGLWTYSHNRSESRFLTFSKDTIYQSVGLGISVSRDIFLYPNIQFVPEDIRSDRTNVALSTNINVF